MERAIVITIVILLSITGVLSLPLGIPTTQEGVVDTIYDKTHENDNVVEVSVPSNELPVGEELQNNSIETPLVTHEQPVEGTLIRLAEVTDDMLSDTSLNLVTVTNYAPPSDTSLVIVTTVILENRLTEFSSTETMIENNISPPPICEEERTIPTTIIWYGAELPSGKPVVTVFCYAPPYRMKEIEDEVKAEYDYEVEVEFVVGILRHINDTRTDKEIFQSAFEAFQGEKRLYWE